MSHDANFQFTFQYVYAEEVIALGAALPAVCIFVVALRCIARRIHDGGLGADDWLAVAALFPTIGMGACLIAGAALKNMGYPTPPPPSDLTEDELAFYVDPTTRENEIIEFPFQILLMLAYAFIKLSILSFYRRVFVARKGNTIDLLLITTGVIVILWAFSFEMLIVFACGKHFWANWDSTGNQLLYCPVAFTSEYGLTISDLILDGVISVILILLVWRLYLTTKRKLALIGIFLLGASAVGASVARLVLYVQVLRAVTAEVETNTNLLLTVSYYWSLLEAGLALIAACLPPLSYLFTHSSELKIPGEEVLLQLPPQTGPHAQKGSVLETKVPPVLEGAVEKHAV